MIVEPTERTPLRGAKEPGALASTRADLTLEEIEDALLTVLPYLVGLLAVIALIAGGFVAAILRPDWLSALGASFSGAEPKAFWYVSRASSLVAYALLWLSMALGLAITNRLARIWPGGPTVSDLHEYASGLGLGFSALHALALLGDRYTGYTLRQVFIPFASANYRPLWVGLGQVGIYLMALVVLSFYVRRWIGYRLWRAVHYLSFGVFVLALAHGLLSGTDSAAAWARDMYWASALSLAALTVYRLVRRGPAPAARTA